MMSRKITAMILFFVSSLTVGIVNAQEVELIKLNQLEQMMAKPTQGLKVFNFWASWCAPCVKELPYFIGLNSQRAKVYLISLDFPQDLDKAKKMLLKKGIDITSFLLDEKDPDKYISKINDSWSGALPASLFIAQDGEREFHEGSLEEEELQEVVESLTRK